MSDGQPETMLERRVILPEPDASNITVLTESLPNEPVLPWHHFDSPWLERDDATAPAEPVATVDDNDEVATAEQLTLELEVLLETAEAGVSDDDHIPPGNSSEGAAA